MRRPRKKTAKKGGVGTITCEVEKDGEEKKNRYKPEKKILRTNRPGGAVEPAHYLNPQTR